ncbi:MAG TPA: hypothetical protein VMR20_07950, partial [Verrucomicrobiae bacterium]|nr:hypothetical protein [Verrucomicrobiae bacterium]
AEALFEFDSVLAPSCAFQLIGHDLEDHDIVTVHTTLALAPEPFSRRTNKVVTPPNLSVSSCRIWSKA